MHTFNSNRKPEEELETLAKLGDLRDASSATMLLWINYNIPDRVAIGESETNVNLR